MQLIKAEVCIKQGFTEFWSVLVVIYQCDHQKLNGGASPTSQSSQTHHAVTKDSNKSKVLLK
jgi:hypothetical protein